VEEIAKPGMIVADIGSWVGGSAAVLAKVAQRNEGVVFCIDKWEGSPGTETEEMAKKVDVYQVFRERMIMSGFWSTIRPMVMYSSSAASIFRDGILDLVFIDADHRHEFVKQDILNWLPKLKDGGILCGHDIFKKYSSYEQEIREVIDNSLDRNAIFPKPHMCIHPGVTRALYEILNDNYTIINASSIWAMRAVRRTTRSSIAEAHPESFHPGHKIDVKACEKMLLDVKEILDAYEIKYWLWFGTFLGIYRDGGLIEWDGDVDLVVYTEDLEKTFQCGGLFHEKGFEFSPWPDAMLYRDGEHMDLSDFRLEGNERVSGYYRVEAADFEADTCVNFLGKKWRIISNPERWLGYLYGADWRIPKKDFITPGRPLGQK